MIVNNGRYKVKRAICKKCFNERRHVPLVDIDCHVPLGNNDPLIDDDSDSDSDSRTETDDQLSSSDRETNCSNSANSVAVE
jgi:hypothetical protein